MKINPVGAELFHADRQTDRHDNAKVAFRTFAKATENQLSRNPAIGTTWSENGMRYHRQEGNEEDDEDGVVVVDDDDDDYDDDGGDM